VGSGCRGRRPVSRSRGQSERTSGDLAGSDALLVVTTAGATVAFDLVIAPDGGPAGLDDYVQQGASLLIAGAREPAVAMGRTVKRWTDTRAAYCRIRDHALAFGEKVSQMILRLGMTLFGGFEIPLESLGAVLRHAISQIIQNRQIDLRGALALLGRLAIPLRGLGRILRNRLTLRVKITQFKLGFQRALLGRLAIPVEGFGGSALDALAVFIDDTEKIRKTPSPVIRVFRRVEKCLDQSFPFLRIFAGHEFAHPLGRRQGTCQVQANASKKLRIRG